MDNLQNLYDEIAPKYKRIMNKRDEVTARIKELHDEMNEAEANYDIKRMEKLTTSLASSKRVYERIENDLKQLQGEMNGKQETSLSSKVRSAAEKDFQAINRNEEVQDKLKKVRTLVQEAQEIKQELQLDAIEKHRELSAETQKFKPFLVGRGRSATLNTLRDFHLVETDSE